MIETHKGESDPGSSWRLHNGAPILRCTLIQSISIFMLTSYCYDYSAMLIDARLQLFLGRRCPCWSLELCYASCNGSQPVFLHQMVRAN